MENLTDISLWDEADLSLFSCQSCRKWNLIWTVRPNLDFRKSIRASLKPSQHQLSEPYILWINWLPIEILILIFIISSIFLQKLNYSFVFKYFCCLPFHHEHPLLHRHVNCSQFRSALYRPPVDKRWKDILNQTVSEGACRMVKDLMGRRSRRTKSKVWVLV